MTTRIEDTFLAECSFVVDIPALANGSRVRVDADTSVLARILLAAHVQLAHANSLHGNKKKKKKRNSNQVQ